MATHVREPRLRGFSAAGTFGGALVAIGVLALVVAAGAAVTAAIGIDPDLSDGRWRTIGWAGVAALGVVLAATFLFGGYVAGRLARGSGARNGLWVAVAALVILGVAWLVTLALVGSGTVADAVRDADIPTSRDVWAAIGIGAAAVAAVTMLAGSVVGGILGARWRPPVDVGVGSDQAVSRDDAEQGDEVDLRDDRTPPPADRVRVFADGSMGSRRTRR